MPLVVLTACSPSRSRNCTTPQAQLVDAAQVRDIEPLAPAGGYIQFGDRTCTVTLLLNSSDNATLNLSAYTAQHCAREDYPQNPSVSLSVYVPSESGKLGGYLKNLPVRDDFFERRKAFVDEVERLGISAASEMSREVTKIPLLAALFYNNAEDQNVSEEFASTFSFCLDKSSRRLVIPSAQQVCWSALDSSVRQLTLRASDIGASKFNQIKNYLERRKENHARALRSVKQFANDFSLWTQRVSAVQGANRLLKYGQLGLFLNENVCKNLAKDDKTYPICAARPVLIGLAEKLLMETDVDGKSKNILKKLDEMTIGINAPFFKSETIPGPNGASQKVQTDIRDIFRDKHSAAMIDYINNNSTELRKLCDVKNDKLNMLGKHYSIAANPVFTDPAVGKSISFNLVRSSALFGKADSVPGIPLSPQGALRFYLPTNQSKIFFNATDSGSMITFGGIIPLLVLHTVDDKPVSGGASILALPEAAPEDIPSVASKTAGTRKPAVAGSSGNTSLNTGVEVSDNDSMISNNGYIAACD